MAPFPPLWKFKTFHKRQRHKNILSIADIIKNSSGINDCLSKIRNVTKREINIIERRTRLQSKEEDWFHYRKGVITGTTTRRVSTSITKDTNRDSINKAISKNENIPLYYPAIVWGRNHEELGIASFIKSMKASHHNMRVVRRGLQLDYEHPYIGASVDGVMLCECCEPAILEIKAPFSLRNGTVANDGKKLQYLTNDLQLKKNHQYYYQLQTYLGVYKYKTGYFCVYTPRDVLILRIDFDENFWRKLKRDLCLYYENYYLKSLFN